MWSVQRRVKPKLNVTVILVLSLYSGHHGGSMRFGGKLGVMGVMSGCFLSYLTQEVIGLLRNVKRFMDSIW